MLPSGKQPHTGCHLGGNLYNGWCSMDEVLYLN